MTQRRKVAEAQSVDQARGGWPRSKLIEEALRGWLEETNHLELEERIAGYSSARDEEDSAEDREWAELSASKLRKTWL